MISPNDPYLAYYRRQQQRQQLHQVGGTIERVFQGAPNQRGHGIGSFLGGMFRTIVPLIKSGVRVVGDEALKSGLGFLGDVTTGVMDPKVAAGARLKQFTEMLKRRADGHLDNVLTGGGGGGGGPSAKIRRVARKRNAKRATRKTPAKRAKRGKGAVRRVTPQSLAKLLGGKTRRRRAPKRRHSKPKKHSSSTSRKRKASTKRKSTKRRNNTSRIRDIFG